VGNLLILLLFVVLLFVGVPVIFSLLVPGVLVCILYPDIPVQLMSARLANSYLSSGLRAIPLFIFAAQILTDIQVADKIFNFVNKCVGHVRGGIAHVNVVASVIFAGMSGSAVADAAGLGKVEIKAMEDQGYPTPFAAAVTAASATIGPIVPPSIPMIVLGSVATLSIGKLLIGGMIPGVVIALTLMVLISLIAKRRGFPKNKFAGFREIFKTGIEAIPGLMTPVILVGGMLCGFFTPTEAATVSVVYSFVIGFCTKKITLKGLWQSFKNAALEGAAMLVTFIGASLIGLLVTRLRLADAAINFMTGFTTSPVVVLLVLNIFLLFVGCLLDNIPAIMLFAPVLVPLVQSYGIDPIHFGVIMVLNLMIGLLTPPFGGLLFITCRVAEINLFSILKEVWPMIISLIVALLIVTFVPQTVLWLPNLFIK
jgi:tripartite ATP-independent transporter DctM subunit